MKSLRNVAIVAHVDHGKTTLVDAMLRQSGVFGAHSTVVDQVMDSNAIERERGITILSKNTAIQYGDYRINIVDTPGHADFGGEVERVLKMVDGVLLVVDAHDGPMPQTRFVLRKALEKDLIPIVVINKMDRPDGRPEHVLDMVYELFIELGATDEQIEFPVLYASGRDGVAYTEIPDDPDAFKEGNIRPLLDVIVDTIPEPKGDPDGPSQMLISNIDYDSYVGKIAIGRIERGKLAYHQDVVLLDNGQKKPGRIGGIMVFDGLKRREVESAEAGEIVCVAGLEDAEIGDTICDINHPDPLPFVNIDEPTISMTFAVNDSPFAGKEGTYVTSRHLRERLYREMKTNVAMVVEDTDTTERFIVKGRGELHLSVLIETMRREGYEFQVSKPEVIIKQVDGVKCEPEELLMIDVPEGYSGVVIEKLGRRKARMVNMLPPEKGSIRMEFRIPSRGLIGYRSEFLTDTRGNGIMSSIISDFIPWQGEIEGRGHGVLVAHESGTAMTYGLYHAQERGELFIGAGTEVYAGMIVGQTMRQEDVVVNICRKKHATNIRAAGSDDALRLVPPVQMSLEQCMEFVDDDEWIEVTPKSVRLRKKILDHNMRMRDQARKQSM